MAQKQKPVHRIRVGRIRAAIWLNQVGDGETWFNVTVSRIYREGEQWRESSTFSRDDLPVVSKVADMAYSWIWGQEVPAQSDSVIDQG